MTARCFIVIPATAGISTSAFRRTGETPTCAGVATEGMVGL